MDNDSQEKPRFPNFNLNSIYLPCEYAVFPLESHFINPQVNKEFICFEKKPKHCDLFLAKNIMLFLIYVTCVSPCKHCVFIILHILERGALSKASAVQEPLSWQLCFADRPWEADIYRVLASEWEHGS